MSVNQDFNINDIGGLCGSPQNNIVSGKNVSYVTSNAWQREYLTYWLKNIVYIICKQCGCICIKNLICFLFQTAGIKICWYCYVHHHQNNLHSSTGTWDFMLSGTIGLRAAYQHRDLRSYVKWNYRPKGSCHFTCPINYWHLDSI